MTDASRRRSDVGPFLSYYGSKWKSAWLYPPPQHHVIVEPFAGSAGYSCRYYKHRVVLIDLNPRIAGIWRYLLKTPASEILALPDLEEGQTVDDLPICQEARDLVGLWINVAVANPVKRMVAVFRRNLAENPEWGGAWGPRKREVLARSAEAVRHWRIHEGGYDLAPNVEATWFVDPPYQGDAGRFYKCSSKNIDFDALGAWCRGRRGQVIVCESETATWLPFRPLAKVVSARMADETSKRMSSEGIWTNEERRE